MTSHAFAPGDRTVPWLDVFPKTCRLKPVKYVCSINARSLPGTTDPDTEFRYVDISNVDSDGNWIASEPMRFGDSPSRARRVVADGDVLVSTVRTYLRAIAHIDRVDEPLICSTGFAVLSANGAVASQFLAYWARSVHFVDEVVARSVGVSYPAVNAPDLGNIPCPVLTLDDQRAIVRFLDRETALIDALIEKKRRQIELLHEKRAALISHAVTKGLDLTAPMKDSGIEWLGEVPAHWKIVQLRRVSSDLQTGPFGSQLHASDYVDNGIPIVNPANIRDGAIVPDPRMTVDEETFARLRRHALQEGDIIFGRRGEMGRCALVGETERGFLCGTGCVRARLHTTVAHPGFVALFLRHRGVHDHLLLESVGSTMDNLNTAIIGRVPVALPSFQEQLDIEVRIRQGQRQVDHLVEMIGRSINRLREYRTTLISAAVTGKIRISDECGVMDQ